MRRIAFVALVCIVANGCYTVFRHPMVEPEITETTELADDETYAIAEGDRCAACHSDWELDQFDYAFHPVYVPVGIWGPWYCEPWWVDEVAPTPLAGTQVQQGAGMTNDRGAGGGGGGTGAGFAPGVWIPGGPQSPSPTIVVLPPATSGPKPVADAATPTSGPKPEVGANANDRSRLDAGRTTQPRVADPLPGAPAGDAPRDATPTESTPPAQTESTPPSGSPSTSPRGSAANDPPARTEPPRSGGSSTSPRAAETGPPAPPPTKPNQGRGMTNDRPRPGR